jgi:DNA invertase Pin-like site-specific DNA recombinase
MSTEHQRYSIENQQVKIAEYAAAHGYDIIDTYADTGRSGLTLRERRELNRLLRDVTDPARQFSTILVLDVSRWGRFQDPDQHAAYEFLCRDMGARVEYVAEVFDNDGSVASSILKHMKRIMAGEFSRDLSAKVAYAQLRAAARGHKQGGSVGIGLRRLLIGADGRPKQVLEEGERKALADDRIVVVPGPAEERQTVRHIFDLFLRGMSQASIGRHLNHIHSPSTFGTPWSGGKVKIALTNELYTGVYVFNRGSTRLKTPRVKNPPSLWVRVPMFPGIISTEMFQEVQRRLASPRTGNGNQYAIDRMLKGLRRLLKEKGRLSTDIINSCPYVPHASTYAEKFGSMERVYAAVGYDAKLPRKHHTRPRRTVRYTDAEMIAQLRRALTEHGHLCQKVLRQCTYTASIPAYRNHFGSLAAAYKAAGYDPPASQRVGANGHDEAIALRQLKELFDKHGRISAAMLYDDPAMPCDVWYRHHFGSFVAACARAGIDYDVRPKSRKFRPLDAYLERPVGGHAAFNSRSGDISDDELLATVRQIYAENGFVNGTLLFSDPRMPAEHRVRRRYAKITHLYAAAGLPPDVPLRTPRRG